MSTQVQASEDRERREEDASFSSEVNISEAERMISLAGGAGLVLSGLGRGGLLGLMVAATGASLVYRGLTGHCMGYQLLDINTAEPQHRRHVSS